MPALTRRREPDRHQECWHVFYGDVHVGSITERAGVPKDVDPWGWSCGFYPAMNRGLRADGIAATFDKARAAFAVAWDAYLSSCTEDDFVEYRRQRTWTTWKYAMQERGCRLPTQMPELRSRCFCGAAIDSDTMDRHIFAVHMAA
jgi:hypothetical protein